MEPIEIITLIWANKEVILDSVAYLVAGAAALAAITPTAKDDRFFSRVLSVVDVLALNVGGARNETPKLAEPDEKIEVFKDVSRLIRHAVKGE